MKFHPLISLVLGGLLLPLAVSAQNYDGQGYAEAGYGADSTLLRYSGGVGLKYPALMGHYYQFGKYLGAELGNIGNGNGLSTPYAFASKSRNFMGVGTLPIGDKFSLFGKFGVAKSSSDYGQNLSIPSYVRERNSDLTYGIGLKYNYNPNLNLRLGWDRYNSLGGEDTYNSQNEVRWFSLGLGLRF
ncbi:MAG TPA: outer membrane beta-barrel protein [Burkholderiales bacterium]|nr:outer membrane beta-barrel protein [Burkholderiales bacterium]